MGQGWFKPTRQSAWSSIADDLWRSHGVVLLEKLDTRYQPLRVLRLHKQRTLARTTAKIWSSKELSVFTPRTPHWHAELPKIEELFPLQAFSSTRHSSTSAETVVALAVCSATASYAGFADADTTLLFKGQGTFPEELARFTATHGIDQAAWLDLTRDSPTESGNPAFGIITEVWYTKRVQAAAKHGQQLAAKVGVPNFMAGTNMSHDASQQHLMVTNDLQPCAFKFVMVTWDGREGSKCRIIDEPHVRPKPLGPAGQHTQSTEWWLDQCPSVNMDASSM